MSEPSPSEIIRWFRVKAKEFADIADTLERTFPGGVASATPQPIVPNLARSVSVEDIVSALGTKSMRVSDIASKLNADPDAVQSAISTAGPRLSMKGRGWIRAAENAIPEVNP